MPRYLIKARYGAEGTKGVATKGGSARRSAIEKMVGDLGGRVETFDFAFGAEDVYTIVELPDNTKAAAVALAVESHRNHNRDHRPVADPGRDRCGRQQTVHYTPPGG